MQAGLNNCALKSPLIPFFSLWVYCAGQTEWTRGVSGWMTWVAQWEMRGRLWILLQEQLQSERQRARGTVDASSQRLAPIIQTHTHTHSDLLTCRWMLWVMPQYTCARILIYTFDVIEYTVRVCAVRLHAVCMAVQEFVQWLPHGEQEMACIGFDERRLSSVL